MTENNNIDLLRAKDAIFKMIAQFHHCSQREKDGSYYISDCYESALERCFQVLGFKEDEVPLMEFCQAWENNNREFYKLYNKAYEGLTAQDYYDNFIEDYQIWVKSWDDIMNENDD